MPTNGVLLAGHQPECESPHLALIRSPSAAALDGHTPRPDPVARATWRALCFRPRGSREIGDGVRSRGASCRGSKPQVLPVSFGDLAGELLVGSQNCPKGIEHVLPGLLAGATLADSAGNHEHARDDPPGLVRVVECDREVD